MSISLVGLDKAEVLAALYNASRPQGMGFMHYDPTPMTRDEAAALLAEDNYFDYLKGRVMKIDLSGDELNQRLYDRDNGEGAAERALVALRSGGVIAPEIVAAHQSGTLAAAEVARDLMGHEGRNTPLGIELGLADVRDALAPAVDGAVAKNEPQ